MHWSLAHVLYSEYAEDTSENAVEIAFFRFSFPLVVYQKNEKPRNYEDIEPLRCTQRLIQPVPSARKSTKGAKHGKRVSSSLPR